MSNQSNGDKLKAAYKKALSTSMLIHFTAEEMLSLGPPSHENQGKLEIDDAYCGDCGEERVATAASFPELTYLWIDVDDLIDKSPLALLPNLKMLNGKPFVREGF